MILIQQIKTNADFFWLSNSVRSSPYIKSATVDGNLVKTSLKNPSCTQSDESSPGRNVIWPTCAALLALIFVAVSIRTLRIRRGLQVAVGDGGNPIMLRAIRCRIAQKRSRTGGRMPLKCDGHHAFLDLRQWPIDGSARLAHVRSGSTKAAPTWADFFDLLPGKHSCR